MNRLAHRILIAVGVFVVAVMAVLVVRSRSVETDTMTEAPAPADLAMQEIRLQEESSGRHWQLVADQASVFEEEGRTALRNITVHVKDKERAWTIVGQEGDLYKQTRDFEIRDDVVVTSDDGLRLETTLLRWRNSDRRLWTDAPVRIIKSGTVVQGRGLEVEMSDEVATVQGPVHATFERAGRR